MGKLSQFADKSNRWVKLTDGGTFEGEYLGYVFMLNQSGTEVPCYRFKGSDGEEKMLQTQSSSLCQFFDEDRGKGKVGETVKIRRSGLGLETRYKAEISNGLAL